MKCDKIRDLISTDYIDGQLNEVKTRQVKEHLAGCGQCSLFEEALRKSAVEPFKNIKEIQPPDYVWERIKENIEEEAQPQKENALVCLRDYLKPLFSIPKPVFAAISVIIFLIALTSSVVFFNSKAQINNYFQEQQEFMNSLENSSGASGAGFGTAIEEYFL